MWARIATSYYMDVQHDILGRPTVFIWNYIMTSVDVRQYLYGRTPWHLWTYTSFMDVQHDLLVRPPVSILTYNITSVGVCQFLYKWQHATVDVFQFVTVNGQTVWHPWTCFSMTYNMASVDVHRFLYGRTTWQPWTSTSFYMGVNHATVDVH